MMQKDERFIAFACTGNTCRSPMAEGIFNKKAEEKGLPVRAVSFGMAAVPGLNASRHAVEVCAEIGVDISGHRTHFVYDYQLGGFEKIYCMSQSHAAILTESVGVPPEKVEVLGIVDPYGGDASVYRMCRDVIAAAVEEIISQLEERENED